MKLGRFEIFPVSDGTFRLDGGAIFGVVPRTMWERTNEPDERNRVLLGINPLLIKTGDENMLVDTGIGDKHDEKFKSIYAIVRRPTLVESLSNLGLRPEDITIVINTHLHFDHAGGNTVKNGNTVKPAFPNARYIVQKGEWEAAANPNERTQASYLKDDFVPVMEAGQFEFIDGDGEITKGVSVFKTSGHNRDIQLVGISSGTETAVYLGDIVPTVTHLKYPYIMGYDLYPLDTLSVKKELITQAAENRTLLIFEHDPAVLAGYVSLEDNGPVFEKML